MKSLKNFENNKIINVILWIGYCLGVCIFISAISKGTNMNIGNIEKIFLYVISSFGILYGLWSILKELKKTYSQYLIELKNDYLLSIKRNSEDIECYEKEIEKISKILENEGIK